MNLKPFVIFKTAFQAYTSKPDLAYRPDPRQRCPLSNLAVANPPFSQKGGARVPQVPHIALQLRPPVKPSAGRRAAS